MNCKWSTRYEAERRFVPSGQLNAAGNEVMIPVTRRAVFLTDTEHGTVIRFSVSKVKGKYRLNDPRHKASGLKGSASLTPMEWVGAVQNMIGVERAVQVLAGID